MLAQRWETAPYRSEKLKRAAEGKSCVACDADDGTTITAHLPTAGISDAGKGIKCDDFWSAHLCSRCHFEADEGKYRNDVFWRAQMVARTMRRNFKNGKVRVA